MNRRVVSGRAKAARLALLFGGLLAGCRSGLASTGATPTRAIVPPPPTASPAPAISPAAPTAAPATPRPAVVPAIDAANAAQVSLRWTLSGHTAGVTDLAFSPDGTWLASASADRTLRVWVAPAWRPAGVLEGHTDTVWSLAFSPDSRRLFSASGDRTVRVWAIPEGDLLETLRSSSFGRALRLAVSPDGLWLAAADQFCLVQIRSTRTGVLYRNLIQPGCGVGGGNIVKSWGLAFTPDGTQLLTAEARSCCGGSIQAWDLAEYMPPRRIQGPNDGVTDLALSSDGTRLAVAFAGSAFPWLLSLPDGEHLQTYSGHVYRVTDLAFSPSGDLLATASSDGTVRLWRVETGELLQTLDGHAGRVTSVAFSADGSLLASGDEQGTVLVWGSSE